MNNSTNPLARGNRPERTQRLRLLSSRIRTEEQRPVRNSRGETVLASAGAVFALERNAVAFEREQRSAERRAA
jgi:hypothetical protein